MSYCTQCGTANPEDAKFCHFCGRSLARQLEEIAQAASSVQPSAFLIGVNLLFLVVIQGVLIFVIPVFGAMFADFGARLPAPTQILLDASAFWKSWWWLGNVPLFFGVRRAYGHPPKRFSLRSCLFVGALLQGLLILAMIVALFLPIFQLGSVAAGVQ